MDVNEELERKKFESVVTLDEGVYWSDEEHTYLCVDRHWEEGAFEAMTLFKGWMLRAIHGGV